MVWSTNGNNVDFVAEAVELPKLIRRDDRQALRDALYSTSGFEGITGTLACDEFGVRTPRALATYHAVFREGARDMPPAQALRSLGLKMVHDIPPIRHRVMTAGLGGDPASSV